MLKEYDWDNFSITYKQKCALSILFHIETKKKAFLIFYLCSVASPRNSIVSKAFNAFSRSIKTSPSPVCKCGEDRTRSPPYPITV